MVYRLLAVQPCFKKIICLALQIIVAKKIALLQLNIVNYTENSRVLFFKELHLIFKKLLEFSTLPKYFKNLLLSSQYCISVVKN